MLLDISQRTFVTAYLMNKMVLNLNGLYVIGLLPNWVELNKYTYLVCLYNMVLLISVFGNHTCCYEKLLLI